MYELVLYNNNNNLFDLFKNLKQDRVMLKIQRSNYLIQPFYMSVTYLVSSKTRLFWLFVFLFPAKVKIPIKNYLHMRFLIKKLQ